VFTVSSVWRSALAAALAMLAIVAGVLPGQLPAYAAAQGGIIGAGSGVAIPGQYIVVLKESKSLRAGAAGELARTLSSQYGGKPTAVYERTFAGYSVAMSEAEARRVAADPRVSYVEQDQLLRIADTQETPPSNGLDRIDQRALPLDNAYTYDFSPSTVSAYVVDTGIRISHGDFGGRAVNGWDFVDSDSTAQDCNGHGTHVAGTIGGTAYGVAKNIRLVAVRAFNCSGTATSTSIQSAIEWITLIAIKPAVVNMSVGIDCVDGAGNPAPCPVDTGKTIKTAISNSIAAGISYVIAAGNQNIDACGSPFNQITTATSVAASTAADAKEPGSNWGSCVNIWAPGANIVSAGHSSDTSVAVITGTSMAAPHVSGGLALIMARTGWATKTPAEVKAQLLLETTPNVLTGLGATSPNKLLFTTPPPVAGGSSVALARNADGRLTLFGVNRGGTLFVRSQTAPNSASWAPWTASIDPNWYSVCADTDNRPHVKLVGLRRNLEVWHRSQALPNANSWSIWQQFDGLLNGCAVALDGTKLEVFGTNPQGQLWRRTQVTPGTGGFTAWSPIGGVQSLRAVAAERNANGLVELFGLTKAGEIWHCWLTAANCAPAGWVQLDGQLLTIAVARNASGALSVFGVNRAGQLFKRDAASGTNNWFSWSQLDVTAAMGTLRSVAAETNADGRIELVAVNLAGQVWRRAQSAANASTYGPWTQLDGLLRP
jgi:subtilisin family serine protease